MNKLLMPILLCAIVCAQSGCTTSTRRYASGETRAVVAEYSEADIQYAVSQAVQSILAQERIVLHDGANRAVMIVENIKVDTTSRGASASPLAVTLGQRLRKELTNSGKIVVLNKVAAKYAKTKVEAQYHLSGVLTVRNPRQDDEDVQREYNLCLTMLDLDSGFEFWQENIHIGKQVGKANINK